MPQNFTNQKKLSIALVSFGVISGVLSGCSIHPEPLTRSDIQAKASDDLAKITAEQAQATSLDINGAIARALKHNRERKLQALQGVLEQGQLDINNFDMLPQLAANAGYSERNNYAASASTTFVNGVPNPLSANPTYSVSQDKTHNSNSIAFTWNVLDFGLSYYRAKQQADRFLIAKERERKVVHNIIQDVRNSYYRAVSAERLLNKIEPLIQSAQSALEDSGKIEQLRAKSPMDALSYQRELLEVLRTLQSLRSDLMTAKTELSTLMGMKPGQNFTLVDVKNPSFVVPNIAVSIEDMEKTALEKRPELVEGQYNRRISAEETKAALVSLLPGISLNAGNYYDDTRYLKNNDWTGVGASVSWNLFNVFKAGTITDVADMKKNLAEEQALATSMAVLSQVHIANIKYAEARRSYDLSDKYLGVAKRITEQVKNANAMQRSGKLELIREELNLVLAELRRDVAYADVQNSYGRIFASMGIDPVESGFKSLGIDELENNIRHTFEQWQKTGAQQPLTTMPEQIISKANQQDNTVNKIVEVVASPVVASAVTVTERLPSSVETKAPHLTVRDLTTIAYQNQAGENKVRLLARGSGMTSNTQIEVKSGNDMFILPSRQVKTLNDGEVMFYLLETTRQKPWKVRVVEGDQKSAWMNLSDNSTVLTSQ